MAEPRTYFVPTVAEVTVDARKGTVEVEVELTDLPADLKHDYDFPYPDEQTDWDAEVITGFLSESLEHHKMTHRMSK